MTGKKVGIIGAGAAGLICAKRLLEEGFEVKIFEQTEQVGGTWFYTDEVGEHIHTSMYKNLKTNLPKNSMSFIGYPFPPEYPPIMKHSQVFEYLNDFAKNEEINQFISFNSKVIKIEPKDEENCPLTGNWSIEFTQNNKKEEQKEEVKKEEVQREEVNFIAICNGHYSKPHFSPVLNISNFKGKIMHSHDYRENKIFDQQRVVIVGGGISSGDISNEISKVAKEIFICLRHHSPSPSPSSSPSQSIIQFRNNLIEIDEKGNLILENGEILEEIETILFCTGYEFYYPFLEGNKRYIRVKYKRVCDLFLHIFPFNQFHPQFSTINQNKNDQTIAPTIAFIGLPWKVTPFPLFDYQSKFIAKVWSSQLYLTSISIILKSIKNYKKYLQSRNLPRHYQHMLAGSLEWKYVNTLQNLLDNLPVDFLSFDNSNQSSFSLNNNNNNNDNDNRHSNCFL